MNDSIRLGQIRGITIRLHYTVPLILGVLALFSSLELVLGYVLMVGPIILLHELGHSIVAQRFGIRVQDITFWPLGGMARMSQIPEDSRIEGAIAIAGPLVNFALALVALPLMWIPALGGPAAPHFFHLPVASAFVYVNLVLGIFNLLPAFPMDGGRVLRAWLGRRGDWLGATERAVHIGRIVAGSMVVLGILTWSPILPLIGLFVWSAGGQELRAVRLRHQGPPARSFGPFRMFWPPGGPPGAGVPPHDAAAPPSAPPPPPPPSRAPGAPSNGGAARAATPVEPDGSRRRGWTDEELERLERFPGRLRQFRSDG